MYNQHILKVLGNANLKQFVRKHMKVSENAVLS